MKKILSVVLAVMMLAAMMVTVSAANNDAAINFVPSTTDITVGDTFTVAMVVTGDTDDSVVCLGGSFKLTASANVTVDSIVAGDAASAFATQNIYTDFAAKKQNINDQDGFAGNGELLVVTFTAKEAGTFTLSDAQTKITFKTIGTTTKYYVQAIDDLTITIKDNAPAFTPETIKGTAVEGDDTAIVMPKSEGSLNTNEYTNVAKFAATLGADVNYSEAGFIWVKDDVETANKFSVDASVIAGGGTFEYSVLMYAIPAGVDIDALPYYVTAE